ncbi:Fe-S cluster assembly sulfur transfer protein SufU [Magnetococcus sp. PR-3]|uniref:Fe-S cluster assembly sulfur transfer protein SufU n=1 Tax=Magnetococcus sp. PR-3 TaxID=3120355 RepID=UPI002FCE04F1
MDQMLREVYEQTILDHNRHPRFYPEHPEPCTHHAHGFNPICGDEFDIHLEMHEGVIAHVGFEGAGCSISTAMCSLMLERVQGCTAEEAQQLFEMMHHLLTHHALPEKIPNEVGKLRVMLGVREHPTRIKCATLGWHILHAALVGDRATICTE